MKRLFLIFLISSITACNNIAENKKDNTVEKSDTSIKRTNQKSDTVYNSGRIDYSNRDSLLAGEFKSFKIYNLADTIKADLNGDKILDVAYFTQSVNRQLFIIDGKTTKLNQVGLEKSFGDMGTQFNWVDFWGTTTDSETFEVIIKDSEIVGGKKTKLDNASLFVRKEEVGGGVITYKNGKYIWVHQSD